MAVKRGIMFELQTTLASDADAAFSALEKRIDALQGRMRFALGGGGYGGAGNFAGGNGGNGGGGGGGGNGFGYGNGNGNGNGYGFGNGYPNGNGGGPSTSGRTSPSGRRSSNRISGFAGGAGYGPAGYGSDVDQKQIDRAIADIQRLQRAADEAQRKDDERARKSAERAAILQGRKQGKLEKSVVDKEEKYQAERQRQADREREAENKAGRRHAQEREREQERTARAAEVAAGRQRESQHRLGEAIGQTTDGLTRMGEGFAYLGLIGQRDLGQLSDSLLRIRGISDGIRGAISTARGAGGIGGAGGGGGLGSILGGGMRSGVGSLLGGAGGLAVGGGAAALALLANMATGGRLSRGLGRGIARGGIAASQHLHNLGNVFETFGMSEAERGQVNYRRATQMEDVNNPSGFGLGLLLSAPGAAMTGNYNYRSGLGHDIDAAAASARNTQRLQRLNQQRQSQRSFFQQATTAELGGELSISGMHRERENAQADIDRERRAAYFRQGSAAYFLGSTRGKGGSRLNYRTAGHTGIGATAAELGLNYADSPFRHGGFFSSARGIHDRGERSRFLQERRDRNAENFGEQERIKQRLGSLAGDEARTRAAMGGIGQAGYDPQAEQQAVERLKQIEEERAQLTRESDQLHRRMREQDIQDAAKLLEFAKKNADVAQAKVSGAASAQMGMREQIGAMNPMQVANLVQARKRAEAGEELSFDQMNVLANAPDERSRQLGRQALRERGDKMLEQSGGAGLIGSQEEFNMGTAQRQAETAYGRLGEGEKELRGVTNQVVVGGEYRVTIDVRDDMQLAEQMHEHQAGIQQQFREHDQKIMAAIRAMISEAMKNAHEQGKAVAGGGA